MALLEDLPNIFLTPNLAEAGLLGEGDKGTDLQNALQSQATKAGLLSAGVSFLTQPRNLRAGSALPYLGRAYQQGMQSAGDIYGTGLTQYARQQAFGQKTPFSAINPADYTQDSLKAYQESGYKDISLLNPIPKEGTTKGFSEAEIQTLVAEFPELAQDTQTQAIMKVDKETAKKILNAKYFGGAGEVKEIKNDRDAYAQGFFGGKINSETGQPYSNNITFADLSPTDARSNLDLMRKNELDSELTKIQEEAKLRIDSPEYKFKTADTLRQSYDKEIKDAGYRELSDNYQKIKSAIDSDTPIGDVASAVSIMKLLDPGSVVRESELEVAMKSTGLWDRMTNFSERTLGGRKLTDAQRVEFEQLAREFYNVAKQTKADIDGRYLELSKKYNIDPALIGMSSVKGIMVYNPATGKLEKK
jgi:hypothetical protein